jgi:ABC-type polysaccharide/polyol phosphate transport system ATPase subunit
VTGQAIEVAGPRKRFGPTLALDGMTFMVEPGRVIGFVGPNGAGKSTTIEVMFGLGAPDEATRSSVGRLTSACGTRWATSAPWSTRSVYTRPKAGATTRCGWPAGRPWPQAGSTR